MQMTGIQRLRKLIENYRAGRECDGIECTELSCGKCMAKNVLEPIADQIEREQDKVAKTDWESVREVAADMAGRTFMSATIDGLLCDWSRKLTSAADGHDHANDVSMSAYDLLPADEREAIAWVREHGGLGAVKAQRCESMPRAAYECKKAGFLDHIAECERALGRRNQRIAELEERVRVRERANDELNEELNAMRPRLMPEGMEWPPVDGKPVVIGERMRSCGIDDCKVVGIDPVNSRLILASDNIEEGKATYFTDFAEHCHRPAPKVLDADGAEIRVGDTVWVVGDAWPSMKVLEIKPDDDPDVPEHLVWCGEMCSEPLNDTKKWRIANQLTHRAPVLAADGKPLREGETVWDENGDELVIGALEDGGHTVTCRYVDVGDAIPVHGMWSPSDLTHERPDSWERLEKDATLAPLDYVDKYDIELYDREAGEDEIAAPYAMAQDLVRRAKKLAGVE